MKNTKKYQYPWRNNNKFKILIDGNQYFSSMLEAIAGAKQQILLEMYLIESGEISRKFIDALISAKTGGIEVYLLLDDYGSKNLSQLNKDELIQSGIHLHLYNPVTIYRIGKSFKRDHRKLLIVDNMIAFIGGAGITDEFHSDNNPHYWHDVMLRAEGEIIQDLADSFQKIWNAGRKSQYKFLPDTVPRKSEFTADNKARFLIGEGVEHNEINRAIIAHIRSSKKHVWLTSPYFITSWKIRRALRYAAKKGVDIRLILPGIHSDHKWVSFATHRYYTKLIRAKIKIYEYQPRFTHSKIIMCDNWFTIGSSNMDRWNQYLNLDANIEVYDPVANKEIENLFLLNFSKSKMVTLNEWSSRSLLQRLKERMSGIIISLLDYISRKFRR